jgi:hypothetical protein
VFVFILFRSYNDGDLYERRKTVLPNFTGEAYDVIYAKRIFSYNIVIYQENCLNF